MPTEPIFNVKQKQDLRDALRNIKGSINLDKVNNLKAKHHIETLHSLLNVIVDSAESGTLSSLPSSFQSFEKQAYASPTLPKPSLMNTGPLSAVQELETKWHLITTLSMNPFTTNYSIPQCIKDKGSSFRKFSDNDQRDPREFVVQFERAMNEYSVYVTSSEYCKLFRMVLRGSIQRELESYKKYPEMLLAFVKHSPRANWQEYVATQLRSGKNATEFAVALCLAKNTTITTRLRDVSDLESQWENDGDAFRLFLWKKEAGDLSLPEALKVLEIRSDFFKSANTPSSDKVVS